MIVICHAPPTGGAGAREDGSDDYSNVFENEKERLVKMLSGKIPTPKRDFPQNTEMQQKENSPHCDISVTSLYFQEYNGLSSPSPEHPVQHAFGLKDIEESLLQCKFEISPGAFFQVTTEGAEVLYSVVVEKLKEVTTDPQKTVLFDVCCGTGTIGLTCLKEGAVGKVVGIDISSPAIANACTNAEKNGFSGTDGTTKFIASRAELAMRNEINGIDPGCPMVAVVDPAREGLHQEVIKALRNEREIKRIIYVSCNPTGSLVKDAGLLCGPTTKRYGGLPFKPTSAQPVDMFPLTDHCEMVLVFDRMSLEEYEMSFDDKKAEKLGSKQQDSDGKEKKGSLVNEGVEEDASTDKTTCTEMKEPSTVEQDASTDKTPCTEMK
jgi:tRNA (uracil-5-)-methyltransferase